MNTWHLYFSKKLFSLSFLVMVLLNITHAESDPSDSQSSEHLTEIPFVFPTTQLQCNSPVDQNFQFVLTARRNLTGHWLADMELQHGAGVGTVADEKNPVEVRLEHWTKACAAGEEAPDAAGASRESLSTGRVSIIEPPPVQAPKGAGYRFFPNFGFYKRHATQSNWRAAREVCLMEGGDLAVIDSDEEAKVLLQVSAPLLFLQPVKEWNREAWVGVSDLNHEGQFTTVHGELLKDTGYERWSRNEPNNFGDEDCVTIVRNGMLNDVSCSREYEFICEVEA